MSKKRVINLVGWAMLAAVLCTSVVYEWMCQGAPVKSLLLGVAMYIAMCAGLGLYIDKVIQEREG